MICRISIVLLLASSWVSANDVSNARDALSKKDTDTSQEKSLEEVFEATENSYSLMPKGETSLNYSMSYSYSADQRINISISAGDLTSLNITPSSSHSLSNNFSFDFGYENNLTIGVLVPLTARYDSIEAISGSGLGDVSLSARYQPYAYVPGKVTKTFNGSFKTKTGDSPFRTISDKRLPTGSGYYSFSGGLSMSKVIDPVMLFGSGNLTYGLPEKNINQVRSDALLTEVKPGLSVSFSGGFAYSLSYDVSLSVSVQTNYTDKSTYTFRNNSGTFNESQSAATMSGIFNMGLGIRVSPKTITNISAGFGMTDDAPDIILSLSMPIDMNGLKAKSS
ncbi:MAG: hypothetical protein ACJA0E_000855 [Bermanella sp.]|jgi:hypothetical protein